MEEVEVQNGGPSIEKLNCLKVNNLFVCKNHIVNHASNLESAPLFQMEIPSRQPKLANCVKSQNQRFCTNRRSELLLILQWHSLLVIIWD